MEITIEELNQIVKEAVDNAVHNALNGIDNENETPHYISETGTAYWYNTDGELHRENGPAIEYADGTKCWFKNGELGRDNDLPAIERINGTREWYENGELHRAHGPAVQTSNRYIPDEWWLNGKFIKSEF